MSNALAEPPVSGPARAATDLVDRLVRHDASAFDEVVRAYRPRLLAVASRYLPQADDAEDAVQEAFVSVMRSIAEFKRESSLGTWIHRVVVNCALMSLRHRRRLHETAMSATMCDGAVCGCRGRDPPPSAYESLSGDELRGAIRREVSRLSEAQRVVLLLHDVDGLELGAIAELLDRSLSTVKNRLHRARLALQDALEPQVSAAAD